MGQSWELFNLDKREYHGCGGKLGEFFFDDFENDLLNLLLSGLPSSDWDTQWGGDRIVLWGDYSQTLPPDTVTDDDPAVLKNCVSTDQPDLNAVDELWMQCTERNDYLDIRLFSLISEDTVCILRSHTRKEYVRHDVLEEYREYSEITPGLAQALFTLVGWSECTDAALSYNERGYVPASGGTTVPLHRGAWAGNRIDIVALTDEVQKTFDEQGWTDISKEKARHVSDVYACRGY